jgi:UDP:flavonoid glycosyltransferase YjiC (YdhE family)
MRVLFSATPGAGHCLPLFPLARAAQRAGHAVTLATAPDYLEAVAGAGIDAIPAGLPWRDLKERFAGQRDALRAGGHTFEERRVLAFTSRFADLYAPTKLAELEAAARDWRPDVIVYESADLAAPLVAALLGVPSVHHSFGRAIPAAALASAAGSMAPRWRAAGLDADAWAGAYRGSYVDICPPSLQSEEIPPSVRVQRLRPADAAPQRERSRPLVYVTLGTAFNRVELFRDLLEAAAELDCDVLTTTGLDLDPAALGPLPQNVRAVRYVPQAETLPETTAVVAHGGSGSTWGALAHGCPIVFVPQGADQFENALAVAEAGAGIALLPGDQSPAAVREALGEILGDERYAVAARAVAAEISALPSADEAAAALFSA